MIAPDDDQTLVDASLAGDPGAFGTLVSHCQDRLYSTLLRITGSHEDARDLLQDVFLRAYEKLHRFHGESSFYTWVYRIAVNLAISEKRRRSASLGRTATAPVDLLDPPSDLERSDPTIHVERAEREALIHRALGQLHEDHRIVVVMRDLDGCRYDEIARILRIPIGTVRSRLHRGRLELRQKLEPLFEPEGIHASLAPNLES
jgi:RNA polymerase sigma-70 factor (ECF subfamily)